MDNSNSLKDFLEKINEIDIRLKLLENIVLKNYKENKDENKDLNFEKTLSNFFQKKWYKTN